MGYQQPPSQVLLVSSLSVPKRDIVRPRLTTYAFVFDLNIQNQRLGGVHGAGVWFSYMDSV